MTCILCVSINMKKGWSWFERAALSSVYGVRNEEGGYHKAALFLISQKKIALVAKRLKSIRWDVGVYGGL